MSEYQAPVRDMLFAIRDLAGLARITPLPGYEEATAETAEAILEQAALLAASVISPTNPLGDEQGTRVENGVVVVPDEFKAVYREFQAGGWAGVTAPEEFGGQGLPFLFGVAIEESGARPIWRGLCVRCSQKVRPAPSRRMPVRHCARHFSRR